MEIPFEVKYLNIEWNNKGEARLEKPSKIVESLTPVKIEKLSHNVFHVELQTYSKIENGQFGQASIRILDSNIISEPLIIDSLNNEINMKLIENTNEKKWWIEDIITKNNGKKNRSSQFFRQAGESKILIGDIICHIQIRTISFTFEELNLFLQDFKENFWKLIFKSDSFVTGNVKQNNVKLLNKKSLSLFNDFLKFSTNILKNPKKELHEIQTLKNIKKVKPIPRTFQEIVTKGFHKTLPSRDYEEIFNIPENKYILFTIKKVHLIISKIIDIQIQDQKYRTQNISTQEKRINSFSNIKQINEKVVLHELLNMENEFEKVRNIFKLINLQDNSQRDKYVSILNNDNNLIQNINSILNKQHYQNHNLELNQFIILLEERQPDWNNKIQFFGKIKKINDKEWDNFGIKSKISLEFDKNLFSFLQLSQEYYINASNMYTVNTYKTIHKIFFNYISELKPINNLNYQTIYVKIGIKKGYSKNQFFGSIKYNLNNEWIKKPAEKHYFTFEFNNEIFGGRIFEGTNYKITGFIETIESSPNANGNIEYKLKFNYIDQIEVISSLLGEKLYSYKKDIDLLKKQNWERPLTSVENQKQDQEKNTLNKEIKRLFKEKLGIDDYLIQLKEIKQKIKKNIAKFEALGIKEDSHLPTSMTFIQNQNYYNIKKIYNNIKALLGINENLYSSILLIEKIGLIDLPTLYERWTLLKIISVLIYEYHFQPQDNWKESLIQQILKLKHDVKIEFKNDKLKKNILFYYEKKLNNGKRPDFVLDIESTLTNTKKRFIMDAKYKENEDISYIIKELYFEKGYSENNKNMVFIIHPDKNFIINNFENPQEWSSQSYYGETELYNFENVLPNHKYGVILLSPLNEEGYYLDNLKRLIAMFLQYGMENEKKVDKNKSNKYDPMIQEIPFCTLCSSINLNISILHNTYHDVGIRYKVMCNDCNHVMEYNYCSGCQNKIIKNGRYWSYYATKPIDIFNIKCPNCGDFRLEGIK